MKYIYKLLFSLAFLTSASQTLTQSFNEPVIGDIDRNYRLDTSAFTSGLPTSVTGSNCAWNFTGLTGAFPLVTDSFVAPTGAPGATAYAGATYVQHRDILWSYYKSTTSPQQTELMGAYSPSLVLTFTNLAIIAGYPVSYGYSLVDPVSGSFKYNTTTGACNGNITITADGLGSVNFATVSIPNCLRLKSVEELTLSIGILPFGSFRQTIYNYYQPGKKFPILSLNYTTYQLLAGTPTITAYAYGSFSYFTVVGTKEQELSKQGHAYPNPFHDQLFINQAPTDGENEYLFYNMSGRLLISTRRIDDEAIGQLDAGVYFLETRGRNGVRHQKLLKE
jgi:hypothetical protein